MPDGILRWSYWKRLWCWEGLGTGGEGNDRGWDGWMASPTQWTWVWVNSGSWWWTGRPSVLRFMGSQSRTWLSNWTELNWPDATSLHKFEIRGDSATSLFFMFQANTKATILDITWNCVTARITLAISALALGDMPFLFICQEGVLLAHVWKTEPEILVSSTNAWQTSS